MWKNPSNKWQTLSLFFRFVTLIAGVVIIINVIIFKYLGPHLIYWNKQLSGKGGGYCVFDHGHMCLRSQVCWSFCIFQGAQLIARLDMLAQFDHMWLKHLFLSFGRTRVKFASLLMFHKIAQVYWNCCNCPQVPFNPDPAQPRSSREFNPWLPTVQSSRCQCASLGRE